MSKQAGISLYILVLAILFILSITIMPVSATQATCNAGGGIYCNNKDSDCKTPGSYPAFDCVVYQNQTVELSQGSGVPPSQTTFEFQKLTISDAMILRFVNKDAPATYSTTATLHSQTGECTGGYCSRPHPCWNNYCPYTDIHDGNTFSRGGLAGGGRFDNNCNSDAESGGGGNGGNGGVQFVVGGIGGMGGAGSGFQANANLATPGGSPGYAGANVLLLTKTLLLKKYSIISVSGDSGSPGLDGCFYGGSKGCIARDMGGSGGLGGGGGAGGSGAGKLVIKVGLLNSSDTAAILANGGDGGGGNCGGNGCESADGGGGGGGGSGQYGSAAVFANEIVGTEPSVECKSGSPGGATSPSGCEGVSGGGAGNAGASVDRSNKCSSGTVPVTETSPSGVGADSSLCSDGVDNDNNGLTDMQDPSCYNLPPAGICPANDGPVKNFAALSKSAASAFDGSDGCCGDDLSAAFSSLPENPVCYPIADPCAGKTTTCLTDNPGVCQWTIQVFSYDPPHCALNKACSSYATQSTCGSSGYCNWGEPACTFDTTYCSKQSQTVCFSPCSWSAVDGCVYDATLPDDSCAPNSYPYGTNPMCLAGLCKWVPQKSAAAFDKDYGFIDSSKQFMCYNTISTISFPPKTGQWSWLDAKANDKAFTVFQLNNSVKTVDTISNGENWFYCNANPAITNGLKGDAIDELSSFKSAAGIDSVYCYQVMSIVFGEELNSTCANGYTGCCQLINNQIATVKLNNIDACAGICWNSAGETLNTLTCAGVPDQYKQYFCDDQNTQTTDPDSLTEGVIEKSSCQYDGAHCVADPNYDKTKSCSLNNGLTCDKTKQYCMNGNYVDTTEEGQSTSVDNGCCFSSIGGSSCKNKPGAGILTENDCVLFGGTVYDPALSRCYGDHVTLSNNKECCFSATVDLADYFGSLGWYKKVSPDSFLCYKENNNNLISQCIYDTDTNNYEQFKNFNIKNMDLSYQRLKSAGTSLHTIRSFDSFNNDGFAIDNVARIKVISGGSNVAYTSTQDKFYLKHYSTLEFDILYPIQGMNLNLVLETKDSNGVLLNKYDLHELSSYSANGNRERRWHHVVIDLTKLKEVIETMINENLGEDEQYGDIVFKDPTLTRATDYYYILIDSLAVKPDSNPVQSVPKDTDYNSLGWYCTGPYGTWIPDLDPSSSVKTKALTDPQVLAPYQYACEAQASFDWTGHYCCGSKTTPTNYGEYFSDSSKGCFAGSKIQNDWTVSYIQNIKESSYEFNNYMYKDLLYFNNSYFGCQVNNVKYADRTVSFDGLKSSSASSILNAQNVVKDEC